MKYQEKLEEIIRETDNMDREEVRNEIETMPYTEITNETSFLWGFEKGIQVALHLSDEYFKRKL